MNIYYFTPSTVRARTKFPTLYKPDIDTPGHDQFEPKGHGWQDFCSGDYQTLLPTKYSSSEPYGFRDLFFFVFFFPMIEITILI